mgnify:CR=1 FL=1
MEKECKLIHAEDIEKYLISQRFDFEIEGSREELIIGFSTLRNYQERTLTWVKSQEKIPTVLSRISACVVQKGVEIEAGVKIVSENSKEVFFSILEAFWGDKDEKNSVIGTGSVIGKSVQLGEGVKIGCNCTIVGEIHIGAETVVGDNVVIRNRVNIGQNCVIQSLSVIGEDGYGYSEDDNHVKTMIKHFGGVVIEDDVFVGSHTNIARGTIDNTVIKKGVKIAPSTHIGHNNYVGENVSIVCSKLFGSVTVGRNSYISSSIIRNQITIGENVIIGMGSVVTHDVPDNKVALGSPARTIRENSGKEKI